LKGGWKQKLRKQAKQFLSWQLGNWDCQQHKLSAICTPVPRNNSTHVSTHTLPALFCLHRSCPDLSRVLTGYPSSFLSCFNLPSPSSKRSPHPAGTTQRCSQQQPFLLQMNSSHLCACSSLTSASLQGDTLLGRYLSTRLQRTFTRNVTSIRTTLTPG